MQREIIRLQYDQRTIIRLDKGPQGIQREGQYGVDYQYTVNDDTGILWLPKQGREALLASGARAGDEVELVKTRRGKDTVFFARKPGDAAEPSPANSVPRTSAARTNGRQLPDHLYTSANNGQQPPTPAANGHTAPQASTSPTAQHLALCFQAAIDACSAAREYARTKEMDLVFNEEDVRAIGLSVYIVDSRRLERQS